MKILIIEDQEKLAKLIKKGLEQEGYSADYLMDGESGQRRLELNHKDYDLLILDLMLPRKSGYEVCKNIRDLKISIPVLVLTAKDGVEDKVSLLDAGADDYIVKPFSFKELLARVRALLRRPESVLPNKLQVGNLILNRTTREAFVDNKEIRLTLKEFALLEFLMRRPNQVVDREQIITNVWDFDVDLFNNIVDVYINKLRNKIDGKKARKTIETVRGVGYRIRV
ncbi:MAG: response regulator transcription factor [Candidatus Portnoybacteria bacterium]|nr:response regulator transcription factor [Candidatus Portnoybacteria bacterium]